MQMKSQKINEKFVIKDIQDNIIEEAIEIVIQRLFQEYLILEKPSPGRRKKTLSAKKRKASTRGKRAETQLVLQDGENSGSKMSQKKSASPKKAKLQSEKIMRDLSSFKSDNHILHQPRELGVIREEKSKEVNLLEEQKDESDQRLDDIVEIENGEMEVEIPFEDYIS